jgi:hypothetical protein
MLMLYYNTTTTTYNNNYNNNNENTELQLPHNCPDHQMIWIIEVWITEGSMYYVLPLH